MNQLTEKQNFIYKMLSPKILANIENEIRNYCKDNVFIYLYIIRVLYFVNYLLKL